MEGCSFNDCIPLLFLYSGNNFLCNNLLDSKVTRMLQHRTRAEVLPNPCNFGFLENQGLQRISPYVKSRFYLKTHVADSQSCRPAFAEAPAPRTRLRQAGLRAGRCKAFTAPLPGFDIVFFCNWRGNTREADLER